MLPVVMVCAHLIVPEAHSIEDLVLEGILSSDQRYVRPTILLSYPQTNGDINKLMDAIQLLPYGDKGYSFVRTASGSQLAQTAGMEGYALGWIEHKATTSEAEVLKLDDLLDKEFVYRWIQERSSIQVGFASHYDGSIDVYWVDPQGQEIDVRQGLNRQDVDWIASYVFHEFVFRDSVSKELVARHVFLGSGAFIIPGKHICNLDSCDPSEWNGVKEATDEDIQNQAAATENARLTTLSNQPKQIPFYTKVGFQKRRIPEDLFKKLLTYYHRNKDNISVEKWSPGSTFVNQRESPPLMATLPEQFAGSKMKREIFDSLKPILEEWSGVDELLPTSCYGIRLYPRGSILRNHVDTGSTHIISAIMNIDQQVDEPWPLNIYDHDGNAHDILMEPGDMVLYESATCSHGRPTRFNGRLFANAFVHFKPSDFQIRPKRN